MQRYAITRRRALLPDPEGAEAALATQLTQWVASGVEWVQVREKDLTPGALRELVRQLATLTAGTKTRLLLNGLGPTVARESGADGVHLTGNASAEAVHTAQEEIGVVSVSCHSLGDVDAAREGGATLVLWAPVFGKDVDGAQVQSGSGLDALRQACRTAGPVPVFALGGVTEENAVYCIEAGAAGVAGIRLFAGNGWRRRP